MYVWPLYESASVPICMCALYREAPLLVCIKYIGIPVIHRHLLTDTLMYPSLTVSPFSLLSSLPVKYDDKWGHGFTVGGEMPAMVRTVKRTSPADNAGLDRGDYILKVCPCLDVCVHTCVYACACVCVVRVCVCVSVCLQVYLHSCVMRVLYMCLSVCVVCMLCVYVFVCLCLCLSVLCIRISARKHLSMYV